MSDLRPECRVNRAAPYLSARLIMDVSQDKVK